MNSLSDIYKQEYMNRQCGTCARLGARQRKYGNETYCTLDGKNRFKNDMRGCLGWKELRRK